MKPPRRRATPMIPPSSDLVPVADSVVAQAMLELHRACCVKSLWTAIVKLLGVALATDHISATLAVGGPSPRNFHAPPYKDDLWANTGRRHLSDPLILDVVQRSPGIQLSDLGTIFGGADVQDARLRQDSMKLDGLIHSVALFFWSGTEIISQVILSRRSAHGGFTPGEKEHLLALHGHLEAAIQRILLLEEQKAVILGLAECVNLSLVPVLLLDSRLRVLHSSEAASQACMAWKEGKKAPRIKSPARSSSCLPQDLAELAARMLIDGSESLRNTPAKGSPCTKEVSHPSIPGLSAQFQLILPLPGPRNPCLRVAFSQQLTEGGFYPLHRLSKSELRVSDLVRQGLSNEEVADSLSISVNTVRSHLREIFSKLGVTSRGRLAQLMRQATRSI